MTKPCIFDLRNFDVPVQLGVQLGLQDFASSRLSAFGRAVADQPSRLDSLQRDNNKAPLRVNVVSM